MQFQHQLAKLLLFSVFLVAIPFILPAAAIAQNELKVGDPVEVKAPLGNAIHKGVITRILPFGTGYLVDYTDERGRQSSGIFQPNEIRPATPKIEFRTWKSRKGNFSVEAKFVSATEEMVTLATQDGETLEVKISLLATVDRRYIRDARKLNPSDGDRSPVKPVFEFPSVEVDFKSAKDFKQVAESGDYIPDPVSLTIERPTEMALSDRPARMVMSADRKSGIFAFGNELGGQYGMQVVDFQSGKQIGSFQIPAIGACPYGVSPDNNYIVTLARRINRDSRIDIWKLEEKQIVHQQGVYSKNESEGGNAQGRMSSPFNIERNARYDFKDVGYLNPSTVYVKSFFELFVVDIVTGKVHMVADFAGNESPSFSGNRKYMVFPEGRSTTQIVIFDCQALKVVKKIPATLVDAAIFSNDGLQVAAIRNNSKSSDIIVFDIATGETKLELTLPFGANKIHWSGDSHLIVDSGDQKLVINVEFGGPVLKYLDLSTMTQVGQKSFAMHSLMAGGKLKVDHFPNQNDLNQNVDMSKLFVQLEGNKVSVDTSKLNLGLLNSKIVDRFEKHVIDSGGTLASGADLKLVAETYAEPKRAVIYSKQGRIDSDKQDGEQGTETTKIFYTPYTSKISLTENGVVVWSKSTKSVWDRKLSGSKAELQRDADAASKPDPGIFAIGKLPVRVPRKDAWDKEIPTIDRRMMGFGLQ